MVVGAADTAALGRFWAELLGWRDNLDYPDEVDLRAPEDDGCLWELVFDPVPDPRQGKNRIHLDLASGSAEHQAQQVEQACDLGARHIDIGQRDVPWVVLADPEGNEFCVLEPRERYGRTGRIAAVVIDAHAPLEQARFWAQATGLDLVDDSADYPALCAADGRGPFLEFLPTDQPKHGKNRLHLDVRPYAGDDQAAEAARLIGLGARQADIGQRDVPWIVLRDPEGNEFCVLTPG